MATDKTNQQIKLKDGRMLGYAEYGDPEGKPVFFFHGAPSSRLLAQPFHESAIRLNVRLIAADRPGMGLSDFQAGRKMLDWPDDVVELADALKLNRFSVMGISGGGPYVAACAFKIPQRLTAAAIVSGGGAFDMPQPIEGIPKSYLQMSWLARRIPWLHRLVVKILLPRQLLRDPDYSSLKAELPEVDRMVLERPGGTRFLRETILEAVRCGTRGVATDYAILARPWGFRLQDISMEVHLWHGENDKDVPPAMARYVASAIPNCQARFLPEEGHFSLAGNHIEEILTILTS